MIADTIPYRYLNDGGAWPRFHWQGLALGDDGALRLVALPAVDGVPDGLMALDAAPRPAGVAVDAEGSIWFSDPDRGVVCRIDGCDGTVDPAPCLAGDDGARPAALAMSVAPARRALYVADAGRKRVAIHDPDTMALVEVLDGFAAPESIALADDGRLYVVDAGAVASFTPTGEPVPAFTAMIRASGRANDPCAVACSADRVYVLDRQTHEIGVFSRHGLVDVVATGTDGARVFAVVDGVVYLADPARRRIAVWSRDLSGAFRHAGDAAGYDGPVAALAGDGHGGLLVAPGGCVAPLRVALAGSHAAEGWLWSDAIAFDTRTHAWNRLRATLDLPAGSHVQFHVVVGARALPPPPPTADGRFAPPWRAVGDDVTDFYLDLDGGVAHEALWVGARLTNDLHATPVLHQLRVAFDQSSYLPALPAIYRETRPSTGPSPQSSNFLLRYVSLYESFFDELEGAVDRLTALVDPAATPSDALPWLAGFLALPLAEQDEAARRAAVATAFARYATRGTVAGLRDALRAEAGVRASIEEPLQAMGWWGLPSPSASCVAPDAGTWTDGGDSILGFNTVLAATEPQGAVVGTTATLDASQLIAQDAFGTPLFEGAAHRFVVRLYPRDAHCAGTLDTVRAIVEREKPAHTLYDLCVIEAGLRIGFQASLGIDTLIGGGPAEPGRLGDGALVLAGEPRGRLGVDSRVGAGAQL